MTPQLSLCVCHLHIVAMTKVHNEKRFDGKLNRTKKPLYKKPFTWDEHAIKTRTFIGSHCIDKFSTKKKWLKTLFRSLHFESHTATVDSNMPAIAIAIQSNREKKRTLNASRGKVFALGVVIMSSMFVVSLYTFWCGILLVQSKLFSKIKMPNPTWK